jgi:DNA-binding response OmpR family regulator
MDGMEQNIKILVADDNPDLTNILGDRLTREGFTVSIAHDGDEAIVKALAEHPDLILLDIMMPKVDGWKVLEKLQDDDWGKTAKVILLTNLSDMDSVSRAVTAGSFDYLVKTDWDISEVITRVKETLARS